MDSQTNTDKSGPGHKAKHQIKYYQPRLMQRVKSDATPAGIVYRAGNKMIEIHQHCRSHRKVRALPVPAKESARHQPRDQEM